MPRVELAERVRNLPPYLFARIDRMKADAIAKGVDVIDMSIGDPDIPTPAHIVEALKRSAENPENHRYPSYAGLLSFRQAVADWYRRRFNAVLDPKTEVVSLIGSKEGIGHMPLAFVEKGDFVLVPTPGYPVYEIGTLFAGGGVHFMPLLEQNDFLPDLAAIPEGVLKKTKLMFLNYPNNPTSASGSDALFAKAIEMAKKYNFIICHDAAYSEVYFEGKRPKSFLEYPGAKEVGMEFHSLSKTYNMTGWRLGFAVGNAEAVAGLGKIKSNLDSGVFQSVQEAGIAALETGDDVLSKLRTAFQERRDALLSGISSIGLKARKPDATFYVWAKTPKGFDSASFTAHLLDTSGVMTTPGNGFGAPGEGYVRFALTVPVSRIREAVERIRKSL